MKVNINYSYDRLHYPTKRLLERMLSPLCGINHEIGFSLHASQDARVVIAGSEMAGVHTLLDMPHPGRGAYHLGGCGIQLNEALVRTLGETVERYSQLTSDINGLVDCQFTSYNELISRDEKVLAVERLNYYLPQQLYLQGFPFEAFTTDQPIMWVKLKSLLNRHYLWVPAQLVFVGYQIKKKLGETRLSTAVTTGTAAHTNVNKALVNAIQELIQIDSAMGHWYSSQIAPQIIFDQRTTVLNNLLSRYAASQKKCFTFHWLKNHDLPGFYIACVFRGVNQSYPRVAIGLGSSMMLVEAMYKSFLEAVGVIGLSRMVIFDRGYHLPGSLINSKQIYDLDTNVAYYALGNQFDFINHKYSCLNTIKAKEMPDDIELPDDELIALLLNGFVDHHKELLFYNLTDKEAHDLGFVVPRVWSPDLVTLSLPSAPTINHSRYLAYGGVQHDNPHPYP